MNYLYEHTWLGLYGHLMIVLAFVGSLFATISYVVAAKFEPNPLKHANWRNNGKAFFISMSIFAICAMILLYYIMLNRYFEFHYVWKYTNHAMGPGYMIASFWSGQEGSLLLWAFWIIIFSFIIIQKFKKWEAPVLGTVSLTLAFIFSMLLGVHIGDLKIGSSPFILIRELPENAGMPWTLLPDYLQRMEGFRDGTGLNPLLQNYWMVIHPPVLFSGFAASLFPFAFALAGLWRKDKNSWLKPARPWTIFAILSLGTGILMGGAWAYESLSFGGFWAWDPVENASLVPWLVLLGAAHCVMIASRRGKGYFMARLFSLLPFLLVIYSSFLTRSGILGESSVHSFTENGLMPHLLIFLFSFTVGAIATVIGHKKPILLYLVVNLLIITLLYLIGQTGILLVIWILVSIAFLVFSYDKYYSLNEAEHHFSSREYWMVTGVLIILISAFQITISTSVPVINRLFGTELDAFTDLSRRNLFYAYWQVPMASMVIFLMAITHLLKYKVRNSWWALTAKVKWPFILAIVFTTIIAWLVPGARFWLYVILLFVTLFAVFSNLTWFVKTIISKPYQSGGALSHIGFALLIAGALISGAGKTPISNNNSSMDLQLLDESFLNNENVMIRKGDTLLMDDYFITYRGKFKENVNVYYNIGYFEPVLDESSNQMVPGDSLFTLYPFIQQNEKFGNVAEPDTRHYLTHDVFTYVKWADTQILPHAEEDDDYMNEITQVLSLGEKLRHDNMQIAFEDIYLIAQEDKKAALGLGENDIAIQARFHVTDVHNPDLSEWVEPVYYIRDSVQVFLKEAYSEKFQTVFKITRLYPEPNTLMLSLQEREYLVMQALVFPGMNILWTGCIVMIIGLALSLFGKWRNRDDKPIPSATKIRKEVDMETVY